VGCPAHLRWGATFCESQVNWLLELFRGCRPAHSLIADCFYPLVGLGGQRSGTVPRSQVIKLGFHHARKKERKVKKKRKIELNSDLSPVEFFHESRRYCLRRFLTNLWRSWDLSKMSVLGQLKISWHSLTILHISPHFDMDNHFILCRKSVLDGDNQHSGKQTSIFYTCLCDVYVNICAIYMYDDDCFYYYKKWFSTLDWGSMRSNLIFWIWDYQWFAFTSCRKKKYVKEKKQLVQDLILPPSIYIQMCTLYTYTKTHLPGFSPSAFFGPSRCLIPTPGLTSEYPICTACVCVCVYTLTPTCVKNRDDTDNTPISPFVKNSPPSQATSALIH